MSAISPYVASYSTAVPYITVAEFQAAPTALELVDLIVGGSQAQQDQALRDKILRASSWADSICNQVLAATVDIERDRYRIDKNGYVRIPLKYKPILEVRGVSFGRSPGTLVALTNFTNVEVYRNTVAIPVLASTLPVSSTAFGGLGIGDSALVDVTYVNGWACTTTSGSASSTNLPVTSALGIYPGMQLVINDDVRTETVTVASSYVPGTATVTLASAQLFTHAAGVSVSNIPSRVKEAVVLLTTALIQTRGSDAIVMESMETPQRQSSSFGASADAIEKATTLLKNLGRVW